MWAMRHSRATCCYTNTCNQTTSPCTVWRKPQTTISGLIHGKRRITTSLAYHLAYVLGTPPEYWLELQMHYDIENYDKFDESGLTVLIDNTVGDTVQSER